MAKPAFTIDQARELRRRYEAGETTVSLAKEHGVSGSCVSSWIKRVGGTIRSNSESKRKYHFDESYWDNIDSQDKAYWLGFLMADGYVTRGRNIQCTLSGRDTEHLSLLLASMKATYSVSEYIRDGYPKAAICLTSIPAASRLIGMGWNEFKLNGSLKILEFIPDGLMRHFIRGFFDGDGSIGKSERKGKGRKSLRYSYNYILVAPIEHYDFLDFVREYIVRSVGVADKSIKRSRRKEDGKLHSVYRCHWNGNQQIKRIGEWMYKDAACYLQRKKDRFDELSNPIRFNWPKDNRFSCSHTPSDISSLPEEQQDKILAEFYKLVMKSTWKAPRYTQEQLLADYRAAIIYNNDLYKVTKDDELVGFRLNTGGSLESPTKKIILHFQPHFWDVKTSSPPIPTQWHNEKKVKRATKALLTTGSKIDLMRYFRELRYTGVGVTSHFHANFACSIIQNLAPDAKSWFDPCLGWGGRLIAAKMMDIKYEGCDPQPNTFYGVCKIKEFIKSDATIHNIKAQDFRYQRRYDIGFTSPPFFNKEKYGGPEQSHHEFPRFDQWIIEFLCPLIDSMMVSCDKVILHIDDAICKAIDKIYSFDRYPLFLQRNPGGKKSTESIIILKTGKL